MDYLLCPRPARSGEAHKYDLARALLNYVRDLAGKEIPLQTFYVTNLCTEFLKSTNGRGTIWIPDLFAGKGLVEIQQTINDSNFRLILPLSLQVSYHLARLGFFDETGEPVKTFVNQARPLDAKKDEGIYISVGKAPFLKMCGQLLHHKGIPVVPILHVKQWVEHRPRLQAYQEPMELAAQEIKRILASDPSARPKS